MRKSVLSGVVLASSLLVRGTMGRAQVAVVAPTTGSSAPTAVSNLVPDTLRDGSIVGDLVPTSGSTVRTGYAAVIVHRPLVQVLAAIHDVEHYRDFIPQFEQSHELSHGPSTQDLFVRVLVAHVAHLWARIRYQQTEFPNGSVSIDGHAVQGNVERMDVRWRLTPVDGTGGTIVEFWSLVLPQLPIALPTGLIEDEQRYAARRGVMAVRARVEAEDLTMARAEPVHP